MKKTTFFGIDLFFFFLGFRHVDKQQRVDALLSDSRSTSGSTTKEDNVSCSIPHMFMQIHYFAT
jgi:hypothetical protein